MKRSTERLVRMAGTLRLPSKAVAVVLGYHRVHPDRNGMCVDPLVFEAQMEELAASVDSRPVMLLDDLLWAFDVGRVPKQSVVITFDDGWADNHEQALPILTSLGLQATVYISSGFIGKPGYLTSTQVLELQSAGIVIGGHTRSHLDLCRIEPSRVIDEVRGGRWDLEDLIQSPVNTFAYPFGSYNRAIVDAVKAAGFKSAVTTGHGWLDNPSQRLTVPRSFAENVDLTTFRAYLKGGAAVMRLLDIGRKVVPRETR